MPWARDPEGGRSRRGAWKRLDLTTLLPFSQGRLRVWQSMWLYDGTRSPVRKESLMPMDFEFPEVRKFKRPRVPGAIVARVLLIVLAASIVMTTWFTIEPEESGLVLRFGKFARQVPSGLHLKLPYPVEKVVKVPIERQLKEEFGFRTESTDGRT